MPSQFSNSGEVNAVGPEPFYIGLTNLIFAIETAYIGAGAMLGPRTITHMRLPRGAALPEVMTISLVPLNGPRVRIVFARGEIESCSGGVVPASLVTKIRQCVVQFLAFRNGPERALRRARLPP